MISQTQQPTWCAESTLGVVAAGGSEAVYAGIEVLKHRGNAADAAVATLLALMVTDHGECSIGGEVPLMIYDSTRKHVKVLSGQGRAPLSPDAIAWYMINGIPGTGNVKIAPVPSVIDLCTTLLQIYGTMTFTQTVSSTLALLDKGTKTWHPRLAVTLRKLVEEERASAGSREQALQSVSDRFYGRISSRTDIADDLEAFYREGGGFLRTQDLVAHTTLIEDPVTVNYHGYTVCKCGPWTQGPFLCQALRLIEDFDLPAMGHLSAEYIHVVIEAIKLAMADRDEYYGDPAFVNVPLEQLLSDRYTALRQPLIDMRTASLLARPGNPVSMKPLLDRGGLFRPGIGGTTTCVVADSRGNVIAATPSANAHDQDTNGGGTTGVTFSNRLLSLNTMPGHPNCIQPGKRPRITLTPTIVLKNGAPVLAISVAGGDLQDQITLNLLLDFIHFGLSPAQAVIAPRFASYHHQDSFNPQCDREQAFLKAGSLTLASTIDKSVGEELAGRGHQLTISQGPIASPVMLAIDKATGLYSIAGDPNTQRHAAGL